MAKKSKADRLTITLECTDCRERNYNREESAQRSAGLTKVLQCRSHQFIERLGNGRRSSQRCIGS